MRLFRIELSRLEIASLLIVAGLGLLNLPYPFHGDQAHFTMAAREMARGQILYKDIWDLTNPGIYLFYLLGGSVFGFRETGIHLFELIYQLAFSFTLLVTLRDRFQNPRIAAAIPLLTVGLQYAVTGAWHLTKTEWLMSFPLYVSLWLASKPGSGSMGRIVLSGIFAGAAVLFKIAYLPVVLLCMATCLAQSGGDGNPGPVRILKAAGLAVVGFAITAAAVTTWFAIQGTLSAAREALFVIPSQVAVTSHHEGLSPVLGVRWFLSSFSGLAALAVIGAHACRPWRARRLEASLVVWALLAPLIIIAQRRFWEYQFQILLVPLGVLGALGADFLWTLLRDHFAARSARPALILAAAMVLSLAFQSVASKVHRIAVHRFALTEKNRLAFQRSISGMYEAFDQDLSFLREPDTPPGTLFVFGDPVFQYLSGRPSAIPMNGWSIGDFTPKLWETLTNQLIGAEPAYILVQANQKPLIEEGAPGLVRWLAEHYAPAPENSIGVLWSRKRQSPPK